MMHRFLEMKKHDNCNINGIITIVLFSLPEGKCDWIYNVLDFWQSVLNFYRLAARRAKNLSPKGFLNALSNPFGCNCSKKRKHRFRDAFIFGPPEGIRTPVLQNRNLLRYPTAPRAEILSLPMKYTMFDVKSQGNRVGLFASFLLFLFDCDIIIIP